MRRWRGSETLHTIAIMTSLEPDPEPRTQTSESTNALGGLIVGNTRCEYQIVTSQIYILI